MKKTKTKKSKEQHHQNKKLKKTSSVLDNNKNKQQIIPFRKKNKNKKPSKQICRKKTPFFPTPDSGRQLNYYSIDDALLFVCAL